jgi:hypothetical protein
LDQTTRMRAAGSTLLPWWGPGSRPDPRLLEFHLRNSVFAQMRGVGQPVFSEYDDDDEEDLLH